MTTLEDIYHPNERNRWFYAKENEYLEVCPLNIVDDISAHEISKVKRIHLKLKNKWVYTTFPKTVKENLKIKHYIKIGEKCPICYEHIFFKKDAFLTDCGHSFHLSCIHSYEMANMYNDRGIFCPVCRSDMGMFGESGQIYYNSKKQLDKLEDFWNNITFIRPKLCYISDYTDHILGLNNNCYNCIEYRKIIKI